MAATTSLRPGDHLRLVTRVARMYYERGMTQQQVAAQLHVSQAKVSRLLKRAEEAGIVKVKVVPPPGDLSEIEERLVAQYALLDAVVADTAGIDEAEITDVVAAAAALYLGDVLLSHEIIGVSSWSSTLLAMVARFTQSAKPVADAVVQVIGGVGDSTAQLQATRLTDELARLTGGRPLFLNAPGMVSSAVVQQAILGEPAMAEVVGAWGRLTVLLAGIGTLEPSTLLLQSGNAIGQAEQQSLRQAGAVGDTCLRFFDAQGRPVTVCDDRVVGIDRASLLQVPRRIGVAGGARKVGAIRAAVRGGWVNVLVTDLATAEQLLS